MSARNVIAHEIGSEEKLLWSGQPVPGVRLRPADVFHIPIGIACCWYLLSWEASVIRMWTTAGVMSLFYILWGIPFVVIGLYLLVGRFFVDALRRRLTFYGVTSERIIIVRGLPRRRTQSIHLQSVTDLTLREGRNGSGTIMVGKPHPLSVFYPSSAWPGWDRMVGPLLELEKQAREVYILIGQAQREACRVSESVDLESTELGAEPIGSSALGEARRSVVHKNSPWSWQPFAVRHAHMVTRLSSQQCFDILKSKVRSASPGGQVWGDICAEGFRIQYKSRVIREFPVAATGEFTPIPAGTLIELSLAPELPSGYSSRSYTALWFGFVLLVLGNSLILILPSGIQGQPPQWGTALSLVALLVLSFGLFTALRSREEAPLLQFLISTLIAGEISPS